MQLLYLYIPDYGILKDVEINFTGKYQFEFDKETRVLKQLPSKNDLDDNFFSLEKEDGPVKAVSALVGNNGAGKTSVAMFLYSTFVNNDLEKIVVWHDGINLCYYSFIYPKIFKSKVEQNGFIESLIGSKFVLNKESSEVRRKKVTKCVEKQYDNLIYNNRKVDMFWQVLLSHGGISVDKNFHKKNSIITPDYNFVYFSSFYNPQHKLSNFPQRNLFDLSTSFFYRSEYKNEGKDLKTLWEHDVIDLKRNITFLNYTLKTKKSSLLHLPIPDRIKISPDFEGFNEFKDSDSSEIFQVLITFIDILKRTYSYHTRLIASILYRVFRIRGAILENGTSADGLMYQTNLISKLEIFNTKYEIKEDFLLSDHRDHDRIKKIESEADYLIEYMSQYDSIFKKFRGFKRLFHRIDDLTFYRSDQLIPFLDELKVNLVADESNRVGRLILNSYFNTFYKYEFLKIDWHPFISSGEYHQINMFARMFHLFKTWNKDRDIILFLDEIEITIHPSLQKQLITNMINFFETFFSDFKVHLIFATHSPILLSDIPKSNTVLLEREGDIVKVKDDEPETFGANIHSLYKNSFLMGKGLIGGFAEKKIETLISDINGIEAKKEFHKESIESRIAILGEPFIKRKIEELYESKLNELESYQSVNDYRERRIKQLEEELHFLKNQENHLD